MSDAAGLGVDQQVLGAAGMASVLMALMGQRGTYNVFAMPPVAKIPQRTVVGEDDMVMVVVCADEGGIQKPLV